MVRRGITDRLIGAIAVALVFAVRGAFPARGLDSVGWAAVGDTFLSLLLWVTFIAVAISLGVQTLHVFAPPDLSQLETCIAGFMLAVGSLGLAAFLLGLIGWLTPTALGIVLVAASAAGGLGPSQIAGAYRTTRNSIGSTWKLADLAGRAVLILSAVIALLAMLHALSPPWDYDGLMYHLVGPRQFLEEGRVVPNSDNWYINAPFTLEMVFSFGLARGDDVFAKLIHLSTGAVLVLAAYAAGRRWLGDKGAWLTTAILMGVPTLPIWAAFAYIDLGWSAFEFLALSAALVWYTSRDSRWLLLAGVLTGFAMGTKYLGLMGAAALGLLVLAASAGRGPRRLLADAVAFGLPALLIATPWYVKNLVWFGNPVYPLYFGGAGYDTARLEIFTQYLNTYGMQRGALGILMLPWDVYANHHRFGAVMNRIDIPAVLFLALLVYPFLRRHRAISVILLVVLIRVGIWALGSQQLRFLMPVYPAMAVGAAYVVTESSARFRPPWRLFLPAVAVGLMVLTLFFQLRIQFQFQPLRPALGLESRRSFLARIVNDFAAARYSVEDLPAGSRVLQLGDGRGYYCLPTCIPDPDHFRWAQEITRAEDYPDFASWAREGRVTHLLLSMEDLDFLLQHDPTGVMSWAVQRVASWKLAGCLTQIYSDDWAQVLALGTCR